MSGKNYLLDTNIVIALFTKESSITEKIRSFPGNIFIPSIVIGELFYGAEKSTRKEENKKKVEALAASSSVLDCDTDTARLYGKIKNHLRDKGTPIPENDIWIASLAEQHQLTIVTRDKHFLNIESVASESW
jgi:tRNA(fMet)-specific endonuclease VapC